MAIQTQAFLFSSKCLSTHTAFVAKCFSPTASATHLEELLGPKVGARRNRVSLCTYKLKASESVERMTTRVRDLIWSYAYTLFAD